MSKKKSNKKGKGLKWGALVLLGLILVSPKNDSNNYDDNLDSDTSIEIQQESTETNSDFEIEKVDTSENIEESEANDVETIDPVAPSVNTKDPISSSKQEDPQQETPKQEEPQQEEPKQEPTVEIPAEENEPTPDVQDPVVEVDPEKAFRDSLNQYFLVGSSKSDKYHSPSCRWTNKINDGNLVHFDSYEEATAAGYQPCGTCQ